MKRIWITFHKKHLDYRKLKFISWFHSKFPGKYCWADCVMWSMHPYKFNPFRVDKSKACEIESIEHDCKACYCGGWDNGKCWDLLPKEERESIKAEREKEYQLMKDDLPF